MPNEPLIAFIAELLRVFGRGIRVKLEIEGKGSLVLTFPEGPCATRL